MKREIVLVQQRLETDCAVACMAMLTGRPYDDVLAAIGDAFDPEQGMRREYLALERLGYLNTFEAGHAVGDICCRHRGFETSAEFFREMAWGRLALMSVPSLNIEGGWHMLLVDHERIFDPSRRRTYSAWRELRPDELVIFREDRR